MKICIVAEGNFPYSVGGVSSWIYDLIRRFPENEFVIWTIISSREKSGKFQYEIPENVSSIYEVYLDDVEWTKSTNAKKRLLLSKKDHLALRSLIFGQKVNWTEVFHLFQSPRISPNRLLMGEDFLQIAKEYYLYSASNLVFTDFLWTLRSIFLPLCLVLRSQVPEADVYHCVATGYAGILGCMAKELYPKSSLIVSEHGIYTREREEELIKAAWIQSVFKEVWIQQFRKLSSAAYNYADIVTSLYPDAQSLQFELGCPKEKALVTPNGVDVNSFYELEQSKPGDDFFDYINIGAVLRIAPIKDIKTLLQAYRFAKERCPKLKLWIMGPSDEEPEYAQECFDIVQALDLHDVIFTGRINVHEYLGHMDMTILTSISEGQPLTILEGFAAHKPAIATDVGNCRGLIMGDMDDYGPAGIVTPIMSVSKITEAIITLANNPALRKSMGEIGFRRVSEHYQIDFTVSAYNDIYSKLADEKGYKFFQAPSVAEKIEKKGL